MADVLEALTKVGVEVGRCGLTYGVYPCRAVMVGENTGAGYTAVFNGSLSNWTTNSALTLTLTPAIGGVLWDSVGTDPIMRTSLATPFAGADNRYVTIEATRLTVASGTWDGKLYYGIVSGHGESGSFYKQITEEFAVGVRTRVVLDMHDLTVGGTDWATGTINLLRLDLDQTTDNSFQIHSIKAGPLADEDTATGSAKCFNTRSTCQDPTHYDSSGAPTSGFGAKIESFKSSPAASSFSLAGRSFGAEPDAGHTRRVLIELMAYASGGAPALNSAKIGGYSAVIRSQQLNATVGVYHVESSSNVFGTSGNVDLVFAGAVAELGYVSYRVIDGVYNASNTNATTPDPTTSVSVPGEGQIFASSVGYLMSTTAWTGVTEDTDDVQSNMFFSSGSYARPEIEALAGRTVTADMSYTESAVPTVVGGTQATNSEQITLAQSGFAANDVVLIVAACGSTTTIPTPSGWTQLANVGVDGVLRFYLFWQRLAGTSYTATITPAASGRAIGRSTVIRGAHPTGSPFSSVGSGSYTAATSTSISAVTTSIGNALVLDIIGHNTVTATALFSGWANANLSSLTEQSDFSWNASFGGGLAVNTGVKAAPGSTGTTSVNMSTSTGGVFAKIAVYPTDYGDRKSAMVVSSYSWQSAEAGTTEEMEFAIPAGYRPQDPAVYPLVSSVEFTSAKIAPGVDLGTRAVLKVNFNDAPHNDAGPGLDKYHKERGYNPYERGSFFGRFRSRYQDLRGHALTWRHGYSSQNEADWEERTFVTEYYQGPSEDGRFSIIGHDPLKLLDGDRAQCPELSEGRLVADIDNAVTTFTLTPSGIGETYPLSGHGTIGGTEVVSFTRVGDVFTIVRGQKNTTPVEHTAADRFQIMKSWSAADPADIINDLMMNYAFLPEDWIPLSEWLAETTGYLRRVYTADVAEPTSVAQLIAELMEQAGLSVWWDALAAQIRLRVLRAIPTSTTLYNEVVFEKGSFSIREQPNKRVSQVWTFYGPISPLAQLDDKANYRSSVLTIDLESEASYGSTKIKKIFSRWISQGGRTAAERVNSLQIARYRTPPRMFSYSLFMQSSDAPELGGGYQIGHPKLQDASGARTLVPVQVLSLVPSPVRCRVEAEEFNYAAEDEEDLLNRQITIDAKTYDLDLKSLHDDLYSPARTGDTVRFIIEAGVIVGQTIAAPLGAVVVGDWPTLVRSGNRTSGSAVISGLSDTADLAVGILVRGTGIPADTRILTIDSASQITLDKNATSGAGTSTSLTFYLVNVILENYGRLQGMGGRGGNGANDNGNSGSGNKNGGAGGTALYSRYYFVLIDSTGKEYGGGGGGAGGSCANFEDHRGGGGGGGAGDVPGAAGIGPQQGEDGQPGTLDTFGAGGRSYTSSVFWAGPELKSNVRGGDGGPLGTAGNNDVNNYDIPGGSPGAAGNAINGISYVNQSGSAGTRLGPQVN